MLSAPLILSLTFCVLSFSLVVFLLVLLMKQNRYSAGLQQNLLTQQMIENQSLRNQLRSPDVAILNSLNYATLPSSKVAEQSSDPIEIDEAVNFEELLAERGYHQGDLGHDFESAGWSPPIIRNGSDGDPVAFDGA